MAKLKQSIKRKLRTRKKLKSLTNVQYRVSVNKSLKNFSAQIIDDKEMKTIVSVSSIEKELKKSKLKKWKHRICLVKYWQKEQKKKK